MGFPSVELEATSKAVLRPLVGLQVWLHGRARDSEWVQVMAARVAEVNPEGLYVHWAGLRDEEDGQAIVQNPRCLGVTPLGTFDLYDMLRIDGPMLLNEELVKRAENQLSRSILTLIENAKPPPQVEPPAPADEKPWWED